MYNGILFSLKDEWDVAMCNNVDGPRKYYVMWNGSDTERQIPCDFTYI